MPCKEYMIKGNSLHWLSHWMAFPKDKVMENKGLNSAEISVEVGLKNTESLQYRDVCGPQ